MRIICRSILAAILFTAAAGAALAQDTGKAPPPSSPPVVKPVAELPAIPFAFTGGAAAITIAVLICLAIVAVIALIRPNRGKGLSLIETSAVLAAAFAAVLICGVIFPGGAP